MVYFEQDQSRIVTHGRIGIACLAESPAEDDHRKFLYVAVLCAGQCKHDFVARGADRFVEILCPQGGQQFFHFNGTHDERSLFISI